MSNFDTFKGFPDGAGPGSKTWTDFWTGPQAEGYSTVPGTRVEQPGDFSPYEQVTVRVSPVIGAVSVEAWFETETETPPLY